MKTEKSIPKAKAQARFDTRLSQSQKQLFEEAARISGFKSLSEFVIYTTQEAATAIVQKHNTILASEKDRKVFFELVANPPKPNQELLKAARNYKKTLAAK